MLAKMYCTCSMYSDVWFCYVLSGWEDITNDGMVNQDACTYNFIIPEVKYYLTEQDMELVISN